MVGFGQAPRNRAGTSESGCLPVADATGLRFQEALQHPDGFLMERDPLNHQILALSVVGLPRQVPRFGGIGQELLVGGNEQLNAQIVQPCV